MSYTPDDQKFGDKTVKTMRLIEELQSVIKFRRLAASEWSAEHLAEIAILNDDLEKLFWKMMKLEDPTR